MHARPGQDITALVDEGGHALRVHAGRALLDVILLDRDVAQKAEAKRLVRRVVQRARACRPVQERVDLPMRGDPSLSAQSCRC